MRIFLLAVRNLSRNKRRTLITALAVVFGATAIVFLQGFVNGFIATAVGNTVLSRVAPVQVHKKGFFGADDPLKVSLPQDPNLIAKIAAVAGVTAVAPRIQFDGMVSNGNEATMFMATAIDPSVEYKVCPKRETNVAEGSKPLMAGDDSKVVIGKTLAESLGAKQGSTLVFQSAGPNNKGTNALDVEVSGFLPSHFVTESKRMATVTLPFAQDLLRMKGTVTELVVGVANLDQTNDVRARVQAALGDQYEVTTWRDMDVQMRDFETRLHYVLLFIAGVLFLLVATGIVNTMLMSVYERVREIGTMLAVGVRRYQITALFLWEAVALGLFGASGGATIGWLIIRHLGKRGVLLHPPGGDPSWMYPHIGFGFIAIVVGFAVVGTMLAALYPAWKASRLQPVEALRAN